MNRFRRAVLLPILVALFASTACQSAWPPGPGPLPPDPPLPPPGSPEPSRLIVTGLVREANGPALNGVLVSTGTGGARSWTATDGTFLIEPRLGDALIFNLPGYFYMFWHAPADVRAGQRLDIEMKLQRYLQVSASAPITTLLTDDDPTHTEMTSYAFNEGPYACGPCKQIGLASPPGTGILRVTWTGDVPLTLWAGEGWSGPTRYAARSGEREIAIAISEVPAQPVNTLLVGLDAGSGPLGSPVTFTVSITAP